MASPLVNAIGFLEDFGMFDVVLPFLLIFTIVFAVLEKSRILGVEEDGKTPKKQLNAMVAFVTGLIVVATNKIVTIINQALPNIILLLVMIILFLMLIGSFMKDQKTGFEAPKWVIVLLSIVSLLAIVLIFMSTIKMENGKSFLQYSSDWVMNNWGGTVFAGFLFFIVVIGAIVYVVKPNFGKKSGGDD